MALSVTTQRKARLDADVRMRCCACDVAWTGPEDSACWFCDERGESLASSLAQRLDAASVGLDEFDRQR